MPAAYGGDGGERIALRFALCLLTMALELVLEWDYRWIWRNWHRFNLHQRASLRINIEYRGMRL